MACTYDAVLVYWFRRSMITPPPKSSTSEDPGSPDYELFLSIITKLEQNNDTDIKEGAGERFKEAVDDAQTSSSNDDAEQYKLVFTGVLFKKENSK